MDQLPIGRTASTVQEYTVHSKKKEGSEREEEAQQDFHKVLTNSHPARMVILTTTALVFTVLSPKSLPFSCRGQSQETETTGHMTK